MLNIALTPSKNITSDTISLIVFHKNDSKMRLGAFWGKTNCGYLSYYCTVQTAKIKTDAIINNGYFI